MSKQKKSRFKIIIWIAVIILAAIVAASVFTRKSATAYKEVKPTNGDITTYYSFTGSIQAKNRKTIYANKPMQIAEILTEAGKSVKKDDVLFKTTMGEEILAPIDGEVVNLKVEVNAQLLAGGALADVVDYSKLQLKVQVDERDISAVSVGKAATIRINALDKEIKGTVSEVSKEGLYQNGVSLFSAVFALDNNGSVNVGMSAEARLIKDDVKNALLLPMSVINFENDNTPYVYIKGEKDARLRRDLKVGVNNGTYVEILEGVTADDSILIVDSAATSKFGFR